MAMCRLHRCSLGSALDVSGLADSMSATMNGLDVDAVNLFPTSAASIGVDCASAVPAAAAGGGGGARRYPSQRPKRRRRPARRPLGAAGGVQTTDTTNNTSVLNTSMDEDMDDTDELLSPESVG